MSTRPALPRARRRLVLGLAVALFAGVALLAYKEPTMAESTLKLESADFTAGQPIPKVHSCEGKDTLPPLSWSGAPAGTKSFALTVFDPDAPRPQGWVHMGIYDVPASVTRLHAGEPLPGKSVKNDFGNAGYGGPCPPPGHGPHHYHFTLYALSVAKLEPAPRDYLDLKAKAQAHALATAELIGTYERR
jgi:Raf kinase inhibitor-like YbhB/YbcL family protein